MFIHFDYARATALGHPFEWIAGNGYSSGNTSLTYPFVLAAGWLAGFRGLSLMAWAAWIACVAVFALLLAVGRVIRGPAAFLAAPLLVGLGALAWSLWSGMEVAFFLAVWGGAFVAFDRLVRTPARPARVVAALAAWGVLLVLTRPEALGTVIVFALVAAASPASVARRSGLLATSAARLRLAVLLVMPAALALAVQAVANRVLTGEWSANGAIVKLAVNNPYLSWEDKLADFRFNVRYAIFRCVEYHFADDPFWGQLVVLLAVTPLGFARTRRIAVLLWLQIASWIAIVALNGQIRWQNERYMMPAVPWLLLLAAVGTSEMIFPPRSRDFGGRTGDGKRTFSPLVAFLIGALAVELFVIAARPGGSEPAFGYPLPASTHLPVFLRSSWIWIFVIGALAAAVLRFRPLRTTFAALALGLAIAHQLPKLRDQRWFFGRASRNIRDQHVVAGRWLAESSARRVLVGDAGALMYISGKPGLDIIGLGGFHSLPFARAGVHGLAASLELIERMPQADRPDVFAIYPSWWGVLSTWFARRELARFPVVGNVICGGSDDVIFEADWHLLGTGESPVIAGAGGSPDAHGLRVGHIVDSVDVADLVSEKEHQYRFTHPNDGWTDMKILADTTDVSTEAKTRAHGEVFDAGRRFSPDGAETFTVHGLARGLPARLLMRTAPEHRERVAVIANDVGVGEIDVAAESGWVETGIALPASVVQGDGSVTLTLQNIGADDFVDYHLWIEQ